jgi:phytanoyl-CoA hydroxylase
VPLTDAQLDLFQNNGFLKLPARLPDETVATLKETILRNMREEVAPVVRDAEGRIVRISQIWDREPIFREVGAAPVVLEALETVLGPDILLVKNRHNHATLNLAGGRGDYWHRDVSHWTRSIVTIIFYLEDAPVERGCTHVIPGTHRLRAFPRAVSTDAHRHLDPDLLDQAVPVPMEAGRMLLINSLVLHRIGTNETPHSRMSMTFGYHSADELDDAPNPKRVLVRGERAYSGNDRGK